MLGGSPKTAKEAGIIGFAVHAATAPKCRARATEAQPSINPAPADRNYLLPANSPQKTAPFDRLRIQNRLFRPTTSWGRCRRRLRPSPLGTPIETRARPPCNPLARRPITNKDNVLLGEGKEAGHETGNS